MGKAMERCVIFCQRRGRGWLGKICEQAAVPLAIGPFVVCCYMLLQSSRRVRSGQRYSANFGKISSLNRNLSSQKELRLEAVLPLIGSMSFDPSPSDKQRTERKRRFLRVATYFTFCGPQRASTPQTSDTTRSNTSGITASATSAVITRDS